MRVADARDLAAVLRQDPVETERQSLLRSLRDFFRRQGLTLAAALALGLALTEAWDAERWDGDLAERLRRWTLPIALAAGDVILERFGPADFVPDDKPLLRALAENALRTAKKINNVTYDRLAEAREAGNPVSEVFIHAQAVRAPEQAQSQATYAESQGRDLYSRMVGLRSKTWRVTSSNPRKSHKDLDGTTIGIDEVFENGCRWPGDPLGDVDEVAGCQCFCEYSFVGPPS